MPPSKEGISNLHTDAINGKQHVLEHQYLHLKPFDQGLHIINQSPRLHMSFDFHWKMGYISELHYSIHIYWVYQLSDT